MLKLANYFLFVFKVNAKGILMVRLNKRIADALGKIPKIKPKVTDNKTSIAPAKKVRHKRSWKSKIVRPKLERSPVADTFQSKTVESANPIKKEKRIPSKKTSLGDIYTASKEELAETYLNDLEFVAQMVPGATFIREANTKNLIKQIKAIIDKLAKREDKYSERGYKEVIRDEIRARMFMLDADQNYEKIIEAMKKKK